MNIASEDSQWVLASQDPDGESVVLTSPEGDGRPLRRARDLVVRGSSYDSETAARAAGERWLSRIKIAFARAGLGADFGDRGTQGGLFYEGGLRMLEERHGGRMLNDLLGLSVFECEPAPQFASPGSMSVTIGQSGADLIEGVRAAGSGEVTMTPQQQLAYSVYSTALSQVDAETRFVMLMTAVEALLPDGTRSDAALALINRYVEDARTADGLEDDDRNSLVGSLEALRRPSINQAGKRLAQALGDRQYMQERPETAIQFFQACYKVRNALVHGNLDRPTREVVAFRAAYLAHFVADLFAVALERPQ